MPCHEPSAVEQSRQSEETQLVIQKGESKARKRVLYFLAAFLFTGFFSEFNFVGSWQWPVTLDYVLVSL